MKKSIVFSGAAILVFVIIQSITVLSLTGCKGPVGPMGPQGLKGDKGDPGADGVSILWMGELSSAPAGAQENWAYYNTTTGNAYIYDGRSWRLLAQDGADGAAGSKGETGANGISIVWQGEKTSGPANPQLNWAYYNSTDNKSYIWDGSAWQVLAKGGEVGPQGPKGETGANGISIVWQGEKTEHPASPLLNWAYYNNTDKKAYIWDGSDWKVLAQDGEEGSVIAAVAMSWRGEYAAAPASPQLNWAYYNSTDKKSYIWDGSSWQILAQDGEIGPEGPKGNDGDSGGTAGTGIYLITFRANGGSFLNGDDVFVLTAALGTHIDPMTVSRQGYTFDGWYKNVTFTELWNFASDTVSAHTSIYAKWIQNVYTVSFDADGGSPAPQNQTIIEGQKASSPAAMGKSGYTFAGWYKDSAFTELWDFGVDTVFENLTLYAKWNRNQNNVYFYPDGGLPEPSPLMVNYGVTLTQPAAMTKPGLTFGGWFKDEYFTEQWDFASDTVTDDIILYAKWGYLVTFNANGGTPMPAQQVVLAGGKISEPPAIKNSFKTWGGWFKESTFITPWNFASDTVSGNVTLYAFWDEYDGFPLTDVADVVPFLATMGAAVPVYLPLAIDLGTMTSSTSGWQNLLSALNTANKYVDLDFSNCTMDGIEFDPDRTVTTGKIFITSIILPDVAESIVAYPGSESTLSRSNSAFNNFTRLKEVSGINITSIGSFAFYRCDTLENVDFPAATSIGNYAFSGCTNLTCVIFPNIVNIGGSAFQGCTSLNSINFPKAVTISDSINNYGTFQNCTGLNSINFPVVTSIGSRAFQGCTDLTNVDFPAATSIGSNAFYQCTGLTSVDFPNVITIENSGSTYGAFLGCTYLVTANFPVVTSIGNYAFNGCTRLATLNIPEVMSIGDQAFYGTSTTALTITMGGIAPTVGTGMFTNVTSLKTVTVKVPTGATGYGVIPSTYSGTSDTNNWGNAFRHKGWNGLAYLTGTVNQYVTLNIQ